MAEISAKIKQMREAHGLSQAQLAEKSKITAAAICQFENGSRSPSLKTLQQLAKALEVPITYLLETKTTDDEHSPEAMVLFRGMKNLDKEDLDFMAALYRTLKNQRKRKENEEKK